MPSIGLKCHELRTQDERVRTLQTDKQTRAQLEANGWWLGSAAEFLDLTPEESAIVEMRLALSDHLRRLEPIGV